MTDTDLTRSLEDAAARTTVGPAPVDLIIGNVRRRRRRFVSVVAAVAVACAGVGVGTAMLGGGGEAVVAEDGAGEVETDLTGTWVIEDLRDVDGASVLPEALRGTLEITFSGQRVSADDGCNSISSAYSQTGPELVIDEVVTEQKGCGALLGGEPVSAPVMGTLERVDSVTGAADNRQLLAADGTVVMELRAVPEPQQPSDDEETDLVGTWVIDDLRVDGASVLPGVFRNVLEMSFDEVAVRTSDGCNAQSATYEQVGSTLDFGAVLSTRVGCQPYAPTSDALGRVASVTGEGDVRRLLDADGEVVVELRRALPGLTETMEPTTTDVDTDLTGDWTVIELIVDQGPAMPVGLRGRITMTFEDGDLVTTDGCGDVTASYEQVGPNLALGPIGSTWPACDGPVAPVAEALSQVGGVASEVGEPDLRYVTTNDGGVRVVLRR